MNIVVHCGFSKLGVILIFGYLLSLSCQSECDRRIYCHDLQIISQDECCYLYSGEICYNDSRRICDSEMGYSCILGRCTGKIYIFTKSLIINI